jgi:hypothetical protein
MEEAMLRTTKAAALALALACDAGAATYYVSPSGSDSNPGTSAAPFKTLARGAAAAVAGDTVLARPGTYVCAGAQDSMGVDINKSGTPSAPITIKSETKWGAVLDGRLLCHSWFNFGSGGHYWVIEGFDISRARWAAVWSNQGGGMGIVVRGNRIHHIGNRPEASASGIPGIYTNESAYGWRIEGNLFHDIGRTGSLRGLDHGIYTHGRGMLIVNNVFYSQNNGRHVQTAAGFSGTIANNTFHGMTTISGKLGHVMLWGTNSDVVVRNNVFYLPRSVGVDTYELSMSGSCSIDHNILYHTSGGLALASGAPSSCAQSANLVNVDPQLNNPVVGGDFRPKSGSPVINAGAAVSGVTTDYNGSPRSGAPDIGAYEGAGAPPPPSDTTPPAITALAVSGLTSAGASVSWTTNEAADTQVEYGTTLSYGSQTPLVTTRTTAHSATLSNLAPGTIYYYRARSKDAAGNAAATPGTFTTPAAPGVPGCAAVAAAWVNAAIPAQNKPFSIQFDAVPGAAGIDGVLGLSNGIATDWSRLAAAVRFNQSGNIDARNGSAYGAAAAIPYWAKMSYTFRLVIDPAAKRYSAFVKQAGGAERLIGMNFAFRNEQAGVSSLSNLGAVSSVGNLSLCQAAVTPVASADVTPPVVSGVAASALTTSGAMIAWTTNEPADTQVEYGPTTGYGSTTVLAPAMTTAHAAALTGLFSGTLYHFRVKSKDAAGNVAVSADATLTTATPAPACITCGPVWKTHALGLKTGTFTVTFDAKPAAAGIDGVIGLSQGAAGDYAKLAAAVRFAKSNRIEARSGAAYASVGTIPYVPGTTYRFRLVVDLTAKRYSAYVKPAGGAEKLIGANFAFRSEQAGAASLDTLSMVSSIGEQSVCPLP